MAKKGILLGNDGELLISNKSMVVGDSEMQEVAIILRMNQGEHKFEPLLGPNLINLTKTKAKAFEIEDRVKLHLALDGKDYRAIKDKIQTNIKN